MQQAIASMSMFGTTGLISIPTAYILPDGKIAFGTSYTNEHYGRYSHYSNVQLAYYVALAYLPFLELNLTATQYPNFAWSDTYTSAVDRMASIKLLLLKEKQYLPSIAIGVLDLYGKAMEYNAQYIVVSKSIALPLTGAVSFHFGYAPNPIKSDRIDDYSIKGGFAGLEVPFFDAILSIMLEYDSQKYNAGLRIIPINDWICIDLIMLGLKYLSGNISFSFDL